MKLRPKAVEMVDVMLPDELYMNSTSRGRKNVHVATNKKRARRNSTAETAGTEVALITSLQALVDSRKEAVDSRKETTVSRKEYQTKVVLLRQEANEAKNVSCQTTGSLLELSRSKNIVASLVFQTDLCDLKRKVPLFVYEARLQVDSAKRESKEADQRLAEEKTNTPTRDRSCRPGRSPQIAALLQLPLFRLSVLDLMPTTAAMKKVPLYLLLFEY
jgi:hypothetical protein